MEKKQMEDSTQQEVETKQGPECEQQKEDIPCEEIKSQDDVSEQEEFTKKARILLMPRLRNSMHLLKSTRTLLSLFLLLL